MRVLVDVVIGGHTECIADARELSNASCSRGGFVPPKCLLAHMYDINIQDVWILRVSRGSMS
jgi:hypothetical protein